MEEFKIVEPMTFEGMKHRPYAAFVHPVMGPVDLYRIDEDLPYVATSASYLPNGARPSDDGSFAVKLYKIANPLVSETKRMVGAYAMFTRQRAASSVGAGPPCYRMVLADVRGAVWWGYTTGVCEMVRKTIGDPASPALLDRLKRAPLGDVQCCRLPLGTPTQGSWSLTRDFSHNCGTYKGQEVCFDFGAQVMGNEESSQWEHPETPVVVPTGASEYSAPASGCTTTALPARTG